MKKSEIVGILLTATIIIGGISYYAINRTDSSTLTKGTITSQTTNSKKESSSVTSKSNNSTPPTKNTSKSITTATSNTTSKQTLTQSEIIAAKNINLAQTAGLTSSSKLYTNEFFKIENQITKKLQNSLNSKATTTSMVNGLLECSQLWNTQVNKMLDYIRMNLTTQQLKVFNKQIVLSKNFVTNEIKETQTVNSSGSIQYLDSATQALYMSGRSANFLLFNYIINNDINPQLSEQFAFSNQNVFSADNGNMTHYTPQQLDFIKQYQNEFTLTQEKSNNYINAATSGKLPITTAYTNVYNSWTSTLNHIYQELNNVSQQSETPLEYNKIWLNYKNQMVDLEGQMYSNPTEKKLAKQRLAIRLTQIECYNLLNQFASSAFSHK